MAEFFSGKRFVPIVTSFAALFGRAGDGSGLAAGSAFD